MKTKTIQVFPSTFRQIISGERNRIEVDDDQELCPGDYVSIREEEYDTEELSGYHITQRVKGVEGEEGGFEIEIN